MKLKGKVAVVTGGGSGLGAAICREFAAQGAVVAVADLNEERAGSVADRVRRDGGEAEVVGVDVSLSQQVDAAADSVEARLGRIDIWVNSAGVSYVVAFEDCSDAIWEKTIGVNLTGTFNGCRAAIRKMLPRRQGVLINMSSQSGRRGNSHYGAYCASKFGVIGLTQSLALEYARRGIRINAICPGVVFTPLWDGMMDDYAKKYEITAEEVKPYLEGKIPMGRTGTPEEIARVALFLASDDAAYITGQSINVSGGAVMQ
jgi:NAD(P)-dependent dehydrogenase (short-subunit alcohol dehydrogenase family)